MPVFISCLLLFAPLNSMDFLSSIISLVPRLVPFGLRPGHDFRGAMSDGAYRESGQAAVRSNINAALAVASVMFLVLNVLIL